jgi:zinc transport system substrate-binding protein
MVRTALRALALALTLALTLGPASAAPRVVTDIAPIQSIAARVMAGVGEPEVILPPGASPHGYALRPSEARRLEQADLVVWVGPALTPWLADVIGALAPHARVLALEDAPGALLLPARAGGPFEADEDAGHEHDHDAAHDGHLWLDPGNAVAAARAIGAALGDLDPPNAAAYAANAEAFAAETARLTGALAAELAPLAGRPFLVFHDAYQYFEHRFAIPAAGSVAITEGAPPGAARVAALRDRVRRDDIVCAFTEPQFEPRLLATILEGSDVRTGVLDPLGASLPPGPGLYPSLLRALADSLEACLAE